jgi:hypothetical protein
MAIFDLLTEVLMLFKEYYDIASQAQTQADIDRAAAVFAKACAKGLIDLVDIFFSVRSALRSVAVVAESGWRPGVWLAFFSRSV